MMMAIFIFAISMILKNKIGMIITIKYLLYRPESMINVLFIIAFRNRYAKKLKSNISELLFVAANGFKVFKLTRKHKIKIPNMILGTDSEKGKTSTKTINR